MSFLWWWNRPAETATTEDDEYRLDHAALDDATVKGLPKIPFAYDPKKPWLFISRSPAFAYSAIITDLDYQFMQNLCTVSLDLTYHGATIQEILEDAIFSDDQEDIETFCNLFQVDGQVYEGVGDTLLMDFLNSLEVPKNGKSSEVDTLDDLYEDVAKHFEAWYGPKKPLKLV